LSWGPARCFCADELYTTKFGNWLSDEIERRFFGPIDSQGMESVRTIANFEGLSHSSGTGLDLLPSYMDAQRMRTPRGLERFQSQIDIRDRNQTLFAMQRLFQLHTTMWTEGVWEVVRARESPTKFIVTDEPVTFFNSKVFPESKVGKYPGDVGLDKVGTRTLFPLGIDSCLLITHVQLVRNPWSDPLAGRVNARAYQQTMMSLLDIQFGRELTEDEVLRVNMIMKRRATRYLAAAEEEWLYPEKRVSIQHWSKLDDDWFLLPHLYKIPFHGEIMVGWKDGSVWAMDEYGRNPGNPNYKDPKLYEEEWSRHQMAEREWARKRAGKSVAHVDNFSREDEVGDAIMEKQLAEGAKAATQKQGTGQ